MLPTKLWRVTSRRPYRSRGPQSWAAERTKLQLAGFRDHLEREAERRAEAERREFAQRRLEEIEQQVAKNPAVRRNLERWRLR